MWGRFLYWQWLQMSCEGIEHLPKGEPYLLAANHTSHLDAGVVFVSLWGQVDRVYSLGAKDYFCDKPVKEWFVRTFLNVIPFERHGNFITGLRDCQIILDRQQPVLLFPEGTRSTTGELQQFKLGLGLLALKLNVPIVPVYIQGTYQALPKGRWFPRQYPIRICFGPPLPIADYKSKQGTVRNREIYQQIVGDVRAAIEQLQNNSNPDR